MNDIGLSKTCLVEFKGLSLGSVQSSGLAYRQYHLQVTVDSHSPDVKFNSITPEQTTTFERNSEVTSPSEQTQNATCISQGDLRGSVWWGFRVEDSAERRAGIEIPQEYLPCTKFQCRSDQTAKPVDIEVASYWSINSQQPISSTAWTSWLTKILTSYSDESRIHYSNIAQFNVLTLPTKAMSHSRYAAKVNDNVERQIFYVSNLKVRQQYGPVEVASGIYGNRSSSRVNNGKCLALRCIISSDFVDTNFV